MSGSFDEVVIRVSSLSTAQAVRTESVREVREHSRSSEGAVSTGNAQGQDVSPTADNRFAHVRCHYCQKLGHISRFCDKKKSDKAASGEGSGDQRGFAGLGPKGN